MVAQRHLFRAQALQEYARSREREILPRMVRPPVLRFCWLLLGLLLIVTLLAWQIQIAISIEAGGVIIEAGPTGAERANQAVVLLAVPTSSSTNMRVGQALSIQLTGQAEPLRATIGSVVPVVLTPDQAQQLPGNITWIITQPSVVVTLFLRTSLPASALVGRTVHTQIQVGSQSLLSLLPDLLKDVL